MSLLYSVQVSGRAQGEVFKANNLWRWQEENRGTETYSRTQTLRDVRHHIARLNRTTYGNVKLIKKPWATEGAT